MPQRSAARSARVEKNKRNNVLTARLVPIFLLAIIGYSSYVVTKQICIDYLIQPNLHGYVRRPQRGAAIAILTIYYILLLIMIACFIRLIQTITINPGLVPRGPQYFLEKERKKQRLSQSQTHKEEALEYGSTEGYTPRQLRGDQTEKGYPAQDFWHKDVFVCGWDGRPPFCSTCYNYKPDRAHHCSELGRCVLKMDHFCPWVGGIVSETSFKYFIQFTGWAAVYTLCTLVFVAYYFAKRQSEVHSLNVHWLLVLIFAALFFVFTAGMCGSSLQFAFLNSSTIENFTRKTKVWYLAAHVPKSALDRYNESGRSDLRLITYPRPAEEQFQVLEQHGATLSDSQQSVARRGTDLSSSQTAVPPATYDPQQSESRPDYEAPEAHPAVAREATGNSRATPETRTFAILETKPGANPFDRGPFNNFKEVMGYTVFDWLIPLRLSPLVDHSDPVSMYKLGKVVKKMARKAGIADEDAEVDGDGTSEQEKPRHKKRRRRSSARSEKAAVVQG
ncbi:Palmitoyltransferase pfa5 [Elasticomyces elasticus]|uniref:Palmitoyltransferase n=1 Tax=Exophiala sideris TaxID=1016849 RepID=A0A0D1VLT9_9EURO|nr:Palmitoyltransferase pfa5 [Elasticomyces elasticus]KAK5032651.1 Palmitoyltransferase pfa5 [Exophiala sideris]KAK5182326.1 Palmitoyltransferase pfa5 [Eurotiomycetes sp. CCFEE 6388]KAK5037168.1 Palmitoyltransferase pfa5 [Exophiala sideris]KAK5062176.1 Palmitoyltransferase pfa5 [Exophiala sideris]